MGFLDFFLKLFEKEKTQIKLGPQKTTPVNRIKINYQELKKLIPGVVKNTDTEYYLPTKQEIHDFLKKDSTSLNHYIKEKFDCDDFALVTLGRLRERFPGHALGYAQSKTHAFNIMVDNQKKLWVIEPQTDGFFWSKNNSLIPKYQISWSII